MNRNFFTRLARKFLLKNGYYQLNNHAHTSFSQMGEDLIVDKIFEGKKRGFYVDVGAFHPTIYSNTYIFYQRGWRGINIDAMPGSMLKFNELRPRDKNVEVAVGRKSGSVWYFKSSGPALNTLSELRVQEIAEMKEHSITGKEKVRMRTLSNVLDKYLPAKQKIDFMNIDVEGLDLEVLQSNNWNRYRPHVVIVESFLFNPERPLDDKIYFFLKNKKYYLVGKSGVSLIFESLL